MSASKAVEFANPVSAEPSSPTSGATEDHDGAGEAVAQLENSASLRRSQLESALKGLKDGTLSEQEAAEVLDRLMVSHVAELRAELTSPDSGAKVLHAVIKSAVAHLTETPTNCTRPLDHLASMPRWEATLAS